MKNSQSGFTIIELTFYLGVILLIISGTLFLVDYLSPNAKIARAQSDLAVFSDAISLLQNDTGQSINHYDAFECSNEGFRNELYLDQPQAGLEATDSGFPNWNGPYIVDVPRDPWNSRYIFDNDYDCAIAQAAGCENVPSGLHRVIYSSGPNGSDFNVYDTDNIVRVLCTR